MLRSHLSAALRSMARSRVYSGISIVGLAIGLAAAILCALVVVRELSWDAFIPGHHRTYLCVSVLLPSGREPDYNAYSHGQVARLLMLELPGIEATARLMDEEVLLRRGPVAARERIYWADPSLFEVLPLPVLQGDLRHALQRPGSVVITRSVAARYFSERAALGQLLEVSGHPMTVTAVLEDLPPYGSQLTSGVFASGLDTAGALARLDGQPPGGEGFQISVYTFLRLREGAAIGPVQQAMPALLMRLWPRRPPGLGATMQLVRIDRLHLFAGLNPGVRTRLAATTLLGLLILAVALINFVNLATARAASRALEVSVRKVCGAGDATLVLAFMAESLLGVALALVLAVSVVEWLLPWMNAFLDIHATFEYWRQPALLGGIAAGAVLAGLAAAVHPALVLAAFRPAQTLRGQAQPTGAAGILSQGLVTAQFAILIGLVIAAAVIYRQRQYATGAALRVPIDRVLILESPCTPALKDELATLPGVLAEACTGRELLSGNAFGNVRVRDGSAAAVAVFAVDPDLLTVYGLQPRAGGFLPAGADPEQPDSGGGPGPLLRHFVINEAAARALGFDSPRAALGRRLELPLGAYSAGTITGVIPDFSLASVTQRIRPAAYYLAPRSLGLIHIKLRPGAGAATLTAIDTLWRTSTAHDASQGTTAHHYLLGDHLDALYRPLLRESQLVALFASAAVALACLGLTGLAAASTARRTREIGVRKALGASTLQMVRLLLGQLLRPVLWASLIAWPAAALVLSHWLQGFAYHVGLEPWLFAAATAIAVLVALATVSTQCYLVARSRPVRALRYE
jgi:putative ABC transport system permease protein